MAVGAGRADHGDLGPVRQAIGFYGRSVQRTWRGATRLLRTRACPVTSIDYGAFPHLDRTWPDHQIAAEGATLGRTIPGSTLLSNDTNPELAARSISVERHGADHPVSRLDAPNIVEMRQVARL